MKNQAIVLVAFAVIALTGNSFAARSASSIDAAIGRFYFETTKGRIELNPAEGIDSKENTRKVTTWKTSDGRIVRKEMTSSKHDAIIRFTAEPYTDISAWGFSIKAEPDEYFTGIMERVVDGRDSASWQPEMTEAMDLRGQKIKLPIKPTLGIYAPFFISSQGYGIFIKGTWPGSFDFCGNDKNLVKVEFEGPSLEFKLYYGPDLAAIVKSHARETGPSFVPPKWALEPWRWRDQHDNCAVYFDGTPSSVPYNSMLVEDILMMEALDIPCSVYWIDRPWATGKEGFDDYNWDPARFPNAPAMIKWLDSKNIKLLLWIAPWVMGDMAKEAVAKGYALSGSDRVDIDFTNPQAKKWWQETGLKKVLEQGVAGFKLDRSEEGDVPQTLEQKVFDGRTTRETRNDYPVQYVRATNEICRQVRGEDFVLIPRAAYTGSAKYSGFWGGDAGSTDMALRAMIIAAQRSAIMGYPVWGSDTCGYSGSIEHDAGARWLAFSCFCPIMEVGPTANRSLWNMPTEPSYDAELLAIWRMYAKLHAGLADYTLKYANEARNTGMPVIRPLFLIYPEQKQAWKDWQTYLYGPDILVSAVWKKGATDHTLYLPKGERWVDAWDTGKVYEGGCEITVPAPLYKIPVFIRKGADVKLGDLNALYAESVKRTAVKPDMAELQKTVSPNYSP